MSRFGIFKINGVDYDLDDLTLDEGEEVENLAGGAIGDLNYGSIKTMKSIAFVLMKRNNSEVTWEEVGAVKMLSFAEAEESMPALPPDVGGGQESLTSPNGSELVDSGTHSSAASTAG